MVLDSFNVVYVLYFSTRVRRIGLHTRATMSKAVLVLEDGSEYEGISFGADISVPGEVGKKI